MKIVNSKPRNGHSKDTAHSVQNGQNGQSGSMDPGTFVAFVLLVFLVTFTAVLCFYAMILGLTKAIFNTPDSLPAPPPPPVTHATVFMSWMRGILGN